MQSHANGIAYLSHPYQTEKGDWTVAAAKNKIEFIAAARCIGILLVVFVTATRLMYIFPPACGRLKILFIRSICRWLV